MKVLSDSVSVRGLTVTCGLVAAAAVICMLVLSGSAGATFPGKNGKIAFGSDRDGNNEVYTMNPDGSDQTNVTDNAAEDYTPSISPDGKKIAFTSDRDGDNEIFTMNVDGSGVKKITDNDSFDFGPTWSPDGKRLAFTSDRDGDFDIYLLRLQNETTERITRNGSYDFSPDWSPDGKSIAFESDRENEGGEFDQEVYTIEIESGDLTNVSQNTGLADYAPSYSPNGNRIAYQSCRPESGSNRSCGFGATPGDEGDFDIVTSRVDGTGLVRLTEDTPEIVDNYTPTWSPDGKKIVYAVTNDRFGDEIDDEFGIYTMDSDTGDNKRRIADNPTFSDFGPDWGVRVEKETEPPTNPPGNPNACTIKGTPKNDRLEGTARRDVICGFGGNDLIYGLGGNDLLRGGPGNDALYGGPGTDRLLGEAGNDRLDGGPGRDESVGGPGRDFCANTRGDKETCEVPR